MTEDVDPLMQALDDAEAGEALSPFGEIEVIVKDTTVSVQHVARRLG